MPEMTTMPVTNEEQLLFIDPRAQLETFLDLRFSGWREEEPVDPDRLEDYEHSLFWQGLDEWLRLGEAQRYQEVLAL